MGIIYIIYNISTNTYYCHWIYKQDEWLFGRRSIRIGVIEILDISALAALILYRIIWWEFWKTISREVRKLDETGSYRFEDRIFLVTAVNGYWYAIPMGCDRQKTFRSYQFLAPRQKAFRTTEHALFGCDWWRITSNIYRDVFYPPESFIYGGWWTVLETVFQINMIFRNSPNFL